MSAPAVVRFWDGNQFCHGIHAQDGRKYHLVVFFDGTVRVLRLPLAERLSAVASPLNRAVRTLRRLGRARGISKEARTLLESTQ